MSEPKSLRALHSASMIDRQGLLLAKDKLLPPKRTIWLKRNIFEFFNSGPGSPISAVVIDTHFRLWRLSHPGARFSDYYASSIVERLKRGGAHRTLGQKKFLSGSVLSGPSPLNPAENHGRGKNYLRLAIAHGLRPEHFCIDYGCGSLRVGQHLIAHLDADNYLGMDVVSDFYEVGMTLLSDTLIANKKPRFNVINARSLDAARRMGPHFIFSFAVLKHVPPAELDVYFRNLIGMMAPRSQAIITFNEAALSSRTGAKIWDYSKEDIVASVHRQDGELDCTFVPLKNGPLNVALPRTSVVLIRREPIFKLPASGTWDGYQE